MNYYAPDFEMIDEDYALPLSKKSSMMEDNIMELIWQNDQVVTKKTQFQPAAPAPSLPYKFDQDAVVQANNSPSTPINIHQQQQLFIQEDEMASWLHYPLNDANFGDQDDLCAAALLYRPPPSSATTVAAAPRVANFPLFSMQRAETGPPSVRSFPVAVVRESTVVDSSVTPAVCWDVAAGRSGAAADSNTTTNRETASETASPGGSSAIAKPSNKAPTAGGWQNPPPDHDRKRKGVDEDLGYHSEDTEFESDNPKKQEQQLQRSTSTKRSRASEVHNLSERRRRDRINEKMKALQELIPCCNKSDKASMLDEAIEYLKSLQLQVQMMSMGCGMVPMMFPGVQQYMSPIGMGLGVGLGMEMSMNRAVMPFHNVLAGASLPMPAAAAHLGPRFSLPAFHMPPVPTDPNRMQGSGTQDPMLNSAGLRVPNFADPYHQYLNLHQMQLPVSQNQATVHSNGGGKPSNSQGTNNLDNNRSD